MAMESPYEARRGRDSGRDLPQGPLILLGVGNQLWNQLDLGGGLGWANSLMNGLGPLRHALPSSFPSSVPFFRGIPAL